MIFIDSINTRIRELRKALGMNQPDFGESIGLSQSSLTMIETGNRAVTERTILMICNAHGVSEEWLRDGTGEMFPPKSADEELAEMFGTLVNGDDEFKQNMISALLQLDAPAWRAIERFVDKLVERERRLNAKSDDKKE